MSEMIHPVRGAFEDWVYSASWEGKRIITQPCKPKTYGGYDSRKTDYELNYKDKIKALSILLETSVNKSPPENKLGTMRKDCLLDILKNPFNPEIDVFLEEECYTKSNNGLISKNIRLMLIAVDMVQPYINILLSKIRLSKGNRYLSVRWIIGGSFFVDETFIVYSYEKNNLIDLKNNNFSDISKLHKTEIQTGAAIWNTSKRKFIFEDIVKLIETNELHYIIVCKVDQDWKTQNQPDPKTEPKTHIVNERVNPKYHIKTDNYEITPKAYFYTDIISIN